VVGHNFRHMATKQNRAGRWSVRLGPAFFRPVTFRTGSWTRPRSRKSKQPRSRSPPAVSDIGYRRDAAPAVKQQAAMAGTGRPSLGDWAGQVTPQRGHTTGAGLVRRGQAAGFCCCTHRSDRENNCSAVIHQTGEGRVPAVGPAGPGGRPPRAVHWSKSWVYKGAQGGARALPSAPASGRVCDQRLPKGDGQRTRAFPHG